jgi:RNA polymerase sigma-54 factor
MSSLSPRLQLRVSQKQILTPGLVQMVTVLQLTRLELKDMIAAEIAENPVLEETLDGTEELAPEELQRILENERTEAPADQSILDLTQETTGPNEYDAPEIEPVVVGGEGGGETSAEAIPEAPVVEQKDPFDEIDYDTFFQEYLDPGPRSPAAESVDKPSFETFLSSPVTLSSHLEDQLAVLVMPEAVREAADGIIGNLDEKGYLTESLDAMADAARCTPDEMAEALKIVQTLDPAGVGARDLRECLLLQLASRNAEGGVAWHIVADHLKLLETRRFKEIAKAMSRPIEHVQIAIQVIRHLNPAPGERYSIKDSAKVEPDVYITKDGEDFLIELNDDEIPQLRLNPDYRRMLDREQEPNKDTRNYIKDRYQAALQLIKNIEQRKQTILKVCQSIIRRQLEFLEHGITSLKPMMIKEVAEEIGVHPSTVSRAVAGKYAHTPQGVFELRYFFSEAVQGRAGNETPLLVLKMRVKKMIEDEDPLKPLTDEQITERLQGEGIQVTRRTVAKYREDMKIPSTHERRRRS